jgi:hypothetical protein
MKRIRGSVTAVEVLGVAVRVWIASPTGDSSDSYLYDIHCLNESQANDIAQSWCEAWDLTYTDLNPATYTVWIGGGEHNERLLTKGEAIDIAQWLVDEGYEDVQVVDTATNIVVAQHEWANS